jgi:gliding motility-associated-like protein
MTFERFSLNRCSFLFLIRLLFFLSFSYKVFSQAVPSNSVNFPRHETSDQRVVSEFFSQPLSGNTNTAQWVVRVNGNIVTTSGVSISVTGPFGPTASPTTNAIHIQFDASSAPGHGGTIRHLLPGETLTIQYTGITLTTGTAPCLGCPVLPFGPFTSKNNYLPTSASIDQDIIYNSEGIEPSGSGLDQCAPVNTDFFYWTYIYSLRYRNSTKWVTNDNQLQVDWGNGSPAFFIRGYLSNGFAPAPNELPLSTGGPGGNPGVLVSFRTGLNLAQAALGNRVVDGTGAFSYPRGSGVCNFKASLFPIGINNAVYTGTGSSALRRNTSFTSFDFDNTNTGALNLNPSPTSSDRVCIGSNLNMRFTDVSTFNCIGNGTQLPIPGQGANPTPVNTQQRWVRIIYGGANSATPADVIPNVFVGGVQVTDASGDLLNAWKTNPVLPGTYNPLIPDPNPGPMDRGYVLTNSGGADANGVIQLPPGATVSTVISELITTSSEVGQVVGQRFYVTLQYWGVCNRYDLGFEPVEYSGDYVEIVSKPTPPIAVNKEFCAGTVLDPPASTCGSISAANQAISFELTAASVTGSTVINWFFGNPLLGGVSINGNGGVYTGGTNCRFFRIRGLANTGAQGTMRAALIAGTPGVYSLWATYSTGANACASLPVEVKMTIRPPLTAPGTPTGTSPVCNGSTINYAQSAAAAAVSIPANTITNPLAVPFGTEYFWDTSNTEVITSSTTGTSVNVSFGLTTQPNPSTTVNIRTALRYSNPITNTTGTPADFCQTAKTPLTVTVFGTSFGGTTSPPTQTICEGNSITPISLSGHRGAITAWEVEINGAGGFNADVSLGTGSTITPLVPVISNVQTTYRFRAVVRNGSTGPCAPDRSSVATIIVNPKPVSAVLSGGATICQGTSTNLVVTITGGTSPYTVTYSDGVGGTFPVSSYVSGTNIPVSPTSTTTYSIVSVTDAANCSPTTLSGTATVTVSNPTSAVMSGSTSICPSPNSTNIVVTITGGASPYTVNYEDDLGGTFTALGYTSGSNINITNITTSRTYTITSVLDANNCPSLSNTGNAVITVGSPLTTATFSGGGSVCQGSTFNLNLAINGGVAPYTINVDNGIGTINNYASGGNILVPTGTVGTVSYNVTLVQDFCTNTLSVPVTGNSQSVTVNPVTVGAATKTVTAICSRANVNVDIFNTSVASGVGGNGVPSTYTWTASYPTGLTGGPGSGSNDIGSTPFTLTNLSGGQLTATFTITPTASSGGCVGNTFQILVPVNTEPVGAASTTVTAQCSDVLFTPINPFTTSVASGAGGNNVLSTFTWTRSTLPTGLNLITAGTNTGDIVERIENGTGGVLNATYTVVPTSTANSCQGASFTIIVPINPEPVGAVSTTTAAQCSSSVFSFNPQTVSVASGAGGNGVISNFTWTASYASGLTGGANSGTGNLAETLVNRSGGVLNATYTVTPTSTTGSCVGDSFTIIVPINAEADITSQPAASTPVCETGVTSPGTASFSITATGPGITYQWQERVSSGTFTNISDGTVSGVTYSGATTNTLTISSIVLAMNSNQYRVIMTTTGSCTVASSVSTLVVNPLPSINSPTISQCSDVAGGSSAVLDLTSFNGSVNNGTGLTFTWWRDAAATSMPITPGTAGGQDQNFTVIDGDVFYVRVRNTVTLCDNIATVTFDINPTPVGNSITGPQNICVSPSTIVYQVTKNPGSVYSWTIPSGFTIAGGGGGTLANGVPGPFANEAFVLLIFSTPTSAPISVTERSAAGCAGAPNTITINVGTAPATVPITGGTTFCKNQQGVVFSVPLNPTSSYVWTANSGATITSASAGTGLNQIVVDFNNTPSAQIDVIETNSDGCASVYPSQGITLVDAPIMSPASASICSGEHPSANLDLAALVTQPSNFSWVVKSITPNITGAFLNETGSGPLQHFTPLTNTSGVDGTIVYTVRPTATSAPNCVGLSRDYSITVKPEPVVNAVLNQSFCPGAFVTIPLASNVSGATMNWTNSDPTIGLSAPSGNGTIGFMPVDNLTGLDITSTIGVSAVSNGCTSVGANAKSFIISIKPRPVVNAITDITVCPGEAITVPNFVSNTGGGESYAWINDNTNIGLGASGSGNITGFFASANDTGIDKVGIISVKGTLNGCEGPATTFRITIKPQPVITGITNKTFCPGDAINIPLTSNVPGATITWNNNNTSIGLLASDTGDIIGTAPANPSGGDFVGTITVTGTNNLCTSSGTNAKSFTITIKPTPIVDAITDITVCSGATVPNIVFGSNITSGGVTFNWTNDNSAINLLPSGSGNIPSFTAATNTTGLPRTAIISVIGVKNGCSGLPTTFRIIVNPEPVVSTITSQSFCPGELVNFTFASNVTGATINWGNTNPLIGIGLTGTGDISFTAPPNNTGGNITGTITVIASQNSCVSTGVNSKTFTITIKPTPVTNPVADVTVCSGALISTIPFTANTGGGEFFSWTNDNSAITSLNGNGNIASFSAPVNVSGGAYIGNFSVSAVRAGCSGLPVNFRIIVNPEPVVTPIADYSFCAGESINISLTSDVPGAILSWTNSDTSIGLAASGNGNISFIAPANNLGTDLIGNIRVVGTSNSCMSSGSNAKTFEIRIKPTPIVNPISNIVVCSGQTISIPSFGSNITSGGVTFDWVNDTPAINLGPSGTNDIASFTAATNTSSNPITAMITVTGTKNLCVGPGRTFTVTIDPVPVMATGLDNTICSGDATGLVLNTNGTSVAALNYNIVSRTPHPSLGIISAASVPGGGINGVSSIYLSGDKFRNTTNAALPVEYRVVPVGAIHNCTGAQATITIMIEPEPVVSSTLNREACSNTDIGLVLNTNGSSIGAASYNILNRTISGGLSPISTATVPANGVADNYLATDRFRNTTSGPITVTYLVEPLAGGTLNCRGAQRTITVTINPEPLGSDFTEPGCTSGVALDHDIQTQITNSLASAFTYTVISSNPGVAPEADRTIPSNVKITHPYTNTTGLPALITYEITPISTSKNCEGQKIYYRVNVDSKPVASGSSIPKLAKCSDEAFTFDPQDDINAGNGVTSTFTWSLVYDGNPAGNGTGNISGSFINVSNAVKNAVFTVTPTSASGGHCVGDPFDIVVPINPVPVMASSLTNPITLCSTNASGSHAYGINLATTSGSGPSSGFNIFLKSIDPGLDGIGATPDDIFNPVVGTNRPAAEMALYTYRNTTAAQLKVIYTVTPVGSIGGCLGTPIDITILVNPEPVLDGPPNPAVCSSNVQNLSTINVTLGTNGTSAVAVNYTIVRIEYSTNGTGGPFSATPPTGVTRITTTGTGINLIKNDRFNNTTAGSVLVRYTIRGTSSLGCQSESFDYDVVINPEPSLAANTVNVCSGLAIGTPITLTPAPSTIAIASFELKQITLGSPSLTAAFSNKPLGTYTAADFLKDDIFFNVSDVVQDVTYKIVPITADGCKGLEQTITVHIRPAPAVASNLDAKVCNEAAAGIVLRDNSSGNSSATPPYSASAASYNIVSAVFNTANLTAVIPAGPLGVTSNFNILGNDSFTNLTDNPQTVIYTVIPISAAGCEGPSKTITLTVEPPIRAVPVNVNPNICSGDNVRIRLESPSNPTPTSTLPLNPLITFNYVRDAVNGIPSVTGNNLGQSSLITDQIVNNSSAPVPVKYKIKAIAASAADGKGCSSILDAEVDVIVEPKPRLSLPSSKTVCEGVQITGVVLSSNTIPSSSNGVVEFELVSVLDPVTGSLSAFVSGNAQVNDVYAIGQSLNDGLSNSSSQPQTIRYTFRPRFSSGLACTGEDVSIDITVNPEPQISFTNSGSSPICSGETFEATMTTTTVPADDTRIAWTVSAHSDIIGEGAGVGDFISQTLVNKGNVPQDVTYTITSSFNGVCPGNTITRTVRVNPVPKFLSSGPNVLLPKFTVCDGDHFIHDLRQNVNTGLSTTFQWDVDDVNQIGVPPNSGTQLDMNTNNFNISSQASLIYQITPFFAGCPGPQRITSLAIAPPITAKFDNDAVIRVCEGTSEFLIFEMEGQAPFDVLYTDGGNLKTLTKVGNLKSVKVTPTVTTEYEIVSVRDALGCTKTLFPRPKVQIEVFKKIEAGWTANISPFISGSSLVNFTNTSNWVDESIFRYEWSFGTDDSPNPASPTGEGPYTVSYSRPGNHFVSLHAVNIAAEAAGVSCEDTHASKIFIPIPPLTAAFKFEPKAACSPQNITVTENYATGDKMDWKIKDSQGTIVATSTFVLPSFLIVEPGTYTISLTTSSSLTGIQAAAPDQEFVVHAKPNASNDLRPAVLYIPDTELITFNYTKNATEYLWDFGDGVTSAEEEPKHVYTVEGKYDITLIAINDYGDGAICRDTLVKQVTAKQGGVTKLPNAFTPSTLGPSGGAQGNNSFNDVFLPIVKGVDEFNMQIFDRWGNLIFESNNSTIGWDGYDKQGKLMPSGVYVYKLTVRLSDGQRSTQVGDITMIR